MADKSTYEELEQEIHDLKLENNHLQENEEKYRLLFETMIQGVVYQDAEGNITNANPSAERLLGLSFDQMQSEGFERHSCVVPSAKEIFEGTSSYKLLPRWKTGGRHGGGLGPDNTAAILDLRRYGPSAVRPPRPPKGK